MKINEGDRLAGMCCNGYDCEVIRVWLQESAVTMLCDNCGEVLTMAADDITKRDLVEVDEPTPSPAPLIIIESIHADEIERRVAALDGYTVQAGQALPETATRAITYIVFMVRRF